MLLACSTDAELAIAFPGTNLETLKRKARSVRASDEALEPSSSEVPSLSLTGDTGTLATGEVTEKITDWTDTLAVWDLDPAVFEVIQPVTMKAWGSPGSMRFSYRANIQRKSVSEDVVDSVDIAGWRETLKNTVIPRNPVEPKGELGYTILVADPQLGKPGTEEALAHWTKGIEGHMDRIENLINNGYNIVDVNLAFMGDEHEGAVGNYSSQPYEIEMNYSDQIALDFDMRVWSIRKLLETGCSLNVVSVPSNHGEHTRFGSSKVLTSPYDNSSTMVAKLAKKVFDGTEAEHYINWYIAEDSQDATVLSGGVMMNFTHGHIAKASGSPTGGIRSKNAIEKQILGRHGEIGDVSIFFSAHYHHFNVIEDRGRTFFGCPALEAEKSSRWFYDSAGVWSKPGMLGMVVGGDTDERGWSELSVI